MIPMQDFNPQLKNFWFIWALFEVILNGKQLLYDPNQGFPIDEFCRDYDSAL